MTEVKSRRMAVLIDGDNADSKIIEQMLNEVSKFGHITIKCLYGDFSSPRMSHWKNQVNKFGLSTNHKFAYTKGKNSTDIALIIDAMDMMYTRSAEGFCIISSDSDFTSIVQRIRKEGLFVMGIGKAHTPEAFANSCDNFIYTEIFTPAKAPAGKNSKKEAKEKEAGGEIEKIETKVPKLAGLTIVRKIDLPEKKQGNAVVKKQPQPINMAMVDRAFERVVDKTTGLAAPVKLSNELRKIDPDFRNFGYDTFMKFVEALKPNYEIVKPDTLTTAIKKTEQNWGLQPLIQANG